MTRIKMNKNNNQSGIFLIILFLIIIFGTFYFTTNYLTAPAELRVNLQTNQIVKGDQGVLFYQVTANKDFLDNVMITNYIVGENGIEQQDISAGKMIKGVSYSDKYTFSTKGLIKDKDYIVKTELSYIYKNETKNEELTLIFRVF